MIGVDAFLAAVVIVSIIIALSIVVIVDRMRKNDEAEVSRVWASYARKKGLSFVPPEGEGIQRSTPHIVADDLQIALIREGDRRITRLEIRPKHSMLGRMLITTERAASDLPRVSIALEALDAELYVHAKPASLAETVVTRDVARAISAFRMGQFLRVEYERGRVVVEWNGGEVNDARLDEARRLAATVGAAIVDGFHNASSVTASAAE